MGRRHYITTFLATYHYEFRVERERERARERESESRRVDDK